MVVPNILSPLINIRIGRNNLTPIPPQFIQSLTIERGTNSFNNFTFTVCDIAALNLEDFLVNVFRTQGNNNAGLDTFIQFGYHDSVLVSPVFKGVITSVQSQFTANYLTLEVSGITTGINSNVSNMRTTRFESNTLISNAVAMIANREGWNIGRIEPTSNTIGNITQANETNISFLSRLASRAISKRDGLTNYTFYFIDGVNRPTLNFIPLARAFNSNKNINFAINSSIDSKVIEFTPEYTSTLINNPNVRTITQSNEISRNNLNVGSSNTILSVSPENRLNTSTSAFRNQDESTLSSLLARANANRALLTATASMTIIGDPTLELLNKIGIIPLRTDGTIHHTGGTYTITKIIHEIAGNFTTSLELVKTINTLPNTSPEASTAISRAKQDAARRAEQERIARQNSKNRSNSNVGGSGNTNRHRREMT